MARVCLIEAKRTPFTKINTSLARFSSLDLSLKLLERFLEQLSPHPIDEMIYSSVLMDPRIPDLGRELVLRSSLDKTITGHFISNNCISGLVASAFLCDGIKTGRIRSGLAGGVETMSQPALLFSKSATNFFLRLAVAKTFKEKLKVLGSFKPSFLSPEAPSPKEPSTGLTMGQHCEIMAKEFKISRERQDEIAFLSHQNAAKAKKLLDEEIISIEDVNADNLIRETTTLEKLSSLKPVFDRSEKGTITAGNSSPLTDGASLCFFGSEAFCEERKIEPLAYIDGIEFASVAPSDGLLMGPAIALPKLLRRFNLGLNDIDRFEIHEAFGAQVVANLDAWEKGFKEEKPLGKIPKEKINVHGGSIALGHPFAATGGRLLSSLARELKRNNLKRGVISVCAAGGGAAAVLLSR